MARVQIDSDELYPYYRLDSEYGGIDATIADQTLERWNRVMAEFRVVQGEMEGVHERAVASLPPRPERVKTVKPLMVVEYACLDDACDFTTLDMAEAASHEAPWPNVHPMVMRERMA